MHVFMVVCLSGQYTHSIDKGPSVIKFPTKDTLPSPYLQLLHFNEDNLFVMDTIACPYIIVW